MGTRHLITICIDGKYPIAQYGQFDGYPERAGVNILNHLRTTSLYDIKAGALAAVPHTKETLRQVYIDLGIDPDSEWISIEDGRKVNEAHPQLDRCMSANIIKFVADNGGSAPFPVLLDLDFAQDSLFCEWAYVIDFDTNTFEVYKGFNHEPLTEGERFYKSNSDGQESCSGNKYYPVKLVASFDLMNLPTNDSFVKMFTEDDDEENEPSSVESL
jgi:hypothetical protein